LGSCQGGVGLKGLHKVVNLVGQRSNQIAPC
jgi:hypothetical protein